MATSLADIRRDYRLAALDEAAAGDDPLAFFQRWFSEAEAAGIDDVNAFTLATSDKDGKPHARIVLLKGLDNGFVFFTNYSSDKGKQLETLPHAAVVFFWKELERQVRVEGRVERVSAEESDAYFHSRPAGSRIGAWASAQSHVVASRDELETAFADYEQKFRDGSIPRPEHWGGYRILPNRIEFWQGRSSRLHDRIVFEKDNGAWKKHRLQP